MNRPTADQGCSVPSVHVNACSIWLAVCPPLLVLCPAGPSQPW